MLPLLGNSEPIDVEGILCVVVRKNPFPIVDSDDDCRVVVVKQCCATRRIMAIVVIPKRSFSLRVKGEGEGGYNGIGVVVLVETPMTSRFHFVCHCTTPSSTAAGGGMVIHGSWWLVAVAVGGGVGCCGSPVGIENLWQNSSLWSLQQYVFRVDDRENRLHRTKHTMDDYRCTQTEQRKAKPMSRECMKMESIPSAC